MVGLITILPTGLRMRGPNVYLGCDDVTICNTIQFCEKCGRARLMEKQLTISQPPPVLVLHLKRFDMLNNRKVRAGPYLVHAHVLLIYTLLNIAPCLFRWDIYCETGFLPSFAYLFPVFPVTYCEVTR